VTKTLQYRTAKVLDDAATLIETKGWCRGRYTDGDRHCTVGALIEVAGPDNLVYVKAYKAVSAEITGLTYSSVPAWNDEQRDRRKVVRTLRRTARKVRRGEVPV